ncbi:MAG: alkaline phosphatase [Bacteroidales bacterium]|nr:alkaline phosphatase [Bacteroidales bacterium]MBN2762414.1 alkaline phosphatase [Bacteroidales bacterium]
MKNKHCLLILSFIIGLNIYHSGCETFAQDTIRPRNVILFIGDGMGLSHIYAAYTRNKGVLNIMKCPYTGFSMTHSASAYITDSGAGGTALSCGEKTYNGAIGMGTDTLPCKTILEYAEEKGMSTGLIATSAITHATPAAFIAHQRSRALYEDIAADFLKTDIDVFIGGGGKHFTRRSDSADLTEQLKNKGYDVIMYPSSIPDLHSDKVAIFTAPDHNPRMSQGRGSMLPDATEKAMSLLGKNDTGFFLMVEGSQIDWGGHNNDIDYIIEELIDMDEAVGKALAFAGKECNTLVIITADHETGGLVVTNGNFSEGTVNVKFTSTGHTGVMVPVFAYGPGAEKFSGVYENTDIFNKLMNLLKIHQPCVSLTKSK